MVGAALVHCLLTVVVVCAGWLYIGDALSATSAAWPSGVSCSCPSFGVAFFMLL